MMSKSLACFLCALSVSVLSIPAKAQEDFEPKPQKKPTKFFKADQFHQKAGQPFPESGFDDDVMTNPFVPPPIPRDGQDASPPWSYFLNPSKGFAAPGEVPPPPQKGNKEPESEATRAQRFIGGPSGIDPFFYSNPMSPPLSPPRRHVPSGGGGGYGLYPYELFMVVQPRQCSNETNNSTDEDVAVKFFSNSNNPEPPRCAHAIASCCAPFNYHIRYQCFEMLGCYGALWDVNPCTESVVATAVNDMATFYKKNGAPENATTPAPTSTDAPATPAAS